MATRRKTAQQSQAEALDVAIDDAIVAAANAEVAVDALFDNWDDDDPSVIISGGFDSELWIPENEGDFIVGFLVGRRFEVGPHKSTMYELDTREGLRAVWGATVLDGRLESVPTNALVRIEYVGERQGRDNTYFDWSVKYKLIPGREIAAVAPAGDVAPY